MKTLKINIETVIKVLSIGFIVACSIAILVKAFSSPGSISFGY